MNDTERVILLNPGRLIFGNDSIDQFVEDFLRYGYTKMMLITIEPMLDVLKSSLARIKSSGIDIHTDTSIVAEPTYADFERILEKAREMEIDSVVGIGGGSVLDTAKLVAAQLYNSQSTEEVKGIGNLRERKTFLVCIPTTSGTGSEVSPNAIFVDTKGAKVAVISPFLVPDAAYVDPALTISVPSNITASTGIDALTHCLEAYTNKFAHPLVDLYALEGVRLIGKYLKRACDDGKDVEARSNVALGSLYGGMCLGPVNTAAVHALSYPLGVEFHVAHGLSNALLLPHVMDFNIPSAPDRYADIARALGSRVTGSDQDIAYDGVHIIKQLVVACGLPSSLAEVDVAYDSIGRLAKAAMNVQRLLKNNPREMTLVEAENIYKAAFNKTKNE